MEEKSYTRYDSTGKLKIGKQIPETLFLRDHEYKRNVAIQNQRTIEEILSRKMFSFVLNCPICSSGSVELGEIQKVTYLECRACKHIFSKLVPSEDALDLQYNQPINTDTNVDHQISHQESTYILDSHSNDLRRRGVEDLKAKWIAEKFFESQNSGKLIDIGCGSGIFLRAAEICGFQVSGIEMDEQLAEETRKLGIQTVILKVTGENWPEKIAEADVLTLLNVVEHVANPVTFVSSLAAKIKRGAWVIIEVPRAESISTLANLAFPEITYRHLTPPEHLHVFSDNSFRQLLNLANLEIAFEWRFGSDSITLLDGILPTEANSIADLFSENFVNDLQILIDKHGMSDNRIVIARKE